MMPSTMSPFPLRMTGRSRFAPIFAALSLAAFVAACDPDVSPTFSPTGRGAVTGQLFFDGDNNNLFSPIGGDTALRRVVVQLRDRGTSRVLATDTTDSLGFFLFDSVQVGTHDVFVVRDTAVTGRLVFCTNPARASVFNRELAYVNLFAKLGCVRRVRDIKADPLGTSVTVLGVVTAGSGTFRTQGDNLFLQDATGGIQAFGSALTPFNLQAGDTVEITGDLAAFNGQLQITNPRVAATIRRGGAPAVPVDRTTAQLEAAKTPTNADIGRLIRVRRARVTMFATATTSNTKFNDGSGEATLRRDGANATRIPTTTFDPAKCYDITGILTIFNGASQLQPRSLADVVEVSCTP